MNKVGDGEDSGEFHDLSIIWGGIKILKTNLNSFLFFIVLFVLLPDEKL